MEILDKYIIKYTNYFKVKEKTFAFRKKELFDVSATPKLMEVSDNNGSNGYWINREWFSLSKIKGIIVNEHINVDVSNLQWYLQEQLNGVFNLR